ncbi:MAG: accessory gene regulator B family protein [Oscillospiraceae bacterium]|nr:accessory gene regulator B family protein [Oscillospiraceae bacterium]
MIHQISQKITDFLIFKGIIEKEDSDVYVYGYETFISGIIDFFLIITIGVFLKCPFNAFIFFIMFVSIRLYTGGYHADTYVKCKITMILILLTVLGLSLIEFPFYTISLLMILLSITVYFQAPIENKNKPLDEMEKKKYHRISIILSLLWGIIAIMIYFFSINISVTISSTAFFITMLMIVEIYRKEEKKNEKE